MPKVKTNVKSSNNATGIVSKFTSLPLVAKILIVLVVVIAALMLVTNVMYRQNTNQAKAGGWTLIGKEGGVAAWGCFHSTRESVDVLFVKETPFIPTTYVSASRAEQSQTAWYGFTSAMHIVGVNRVSPIKVEVKGNIFNPFGGKDVIGETQPAKLDECS